MAEADHPTTRQPKPPNDPPTPTKRTRRALLAFSAVTAVGAATALTYFSGVIHDPPFNGAVNANPTSPSSSPSDQDGFGGYAFDGQFHDNVEWSALADIFPAATLAGTGCSHNNDSERDTNVEAEMYRGECGALLEDDPAGSITAELRVFESTDSASEAFEHGIRDVECLGCDTGNVSGWEQGRYGIITEDTDTGYAERAYLRVQQGTLWIDVQLTADSEDTSPLEDLDDRTLTGLTDFVTSLEGAMHR